MTGGDELLSDMLGAPTGSEQAKLALEMNDPWFWHKLVPGLTLRDRRSRTGEDVDANEVARAVERLGGDGFAAVRAGIVPHPGILEGIHALLARGLPPVFIFVYDEPWHHLGRLRALFSALLGEEYLLDSGMWIWHVPIGPAHAGWLPHRDFPQRPSCDSQGRPWALSTWIPLTPATPDNGCMYVLPARYARGELHSSNIRDAHALPARPGDALFWRHDVWHWGGRSTEYAENPRTSLGVELMRPGAPSQFGPVCPPDSIPDVKTRLALCGANLRRYDRDANWLTLGSYLIKLDPHVQAASEK